MPEAAGPGGGEALVAGLRTEARRLGLSALGIAAPEPSSHMERYRAWIAEGGHGEMAYLAREDAVARRADLRGTMADVRSVVVVAEDYYAPDGEERVADPARAVVARYARGDDYHDVLKAKLLALLAWLDGAAPGGARGRAYVDTGPILERELAQRAGLGWFGRNTMLIHPERGSFFFLGVVLVDVELPPSAPFEEDRCGTCRACLAACPTGALLGRDERGAPRMDARRCISYLTIELRGPIPVELRRGIGNRVFGCDICQDVCPWNERFARPGRERAYAARAGLDTPALVELAGELIGMDEAGFRARFRGSPLRRAGRSGLLRNVCVALGNAGSDHGVPTLARALADEDPIVREHASWALDLIGSPAAAAALADAGVEGSP